MTKRWFVVATSFAAPVFSIMSTKVVYGRTAREALKKFVDAYDHSAGLYAARVYRSAADYDTNKKPRLAWTCNHERKLRSLTRKKSCYSYYGRGPGDFEIDGVNYKVKNPKEGRYENLR